MISCHPKPYHLRWGGNLPELWFCFLHVPVSKRTRPRVVLWKQIIKKNCVRKNEKENWVPFSGKFQSQKTRDAHAGRRKIAEQNSILNSSIVLWSNQKKSHREYFCWLLLGAAAAAARSTCVFVRMIFRRFPLPACVETKFSTAVADVLVEHYRRETFEW